MPRCKVNLTYAVLRKQIDKLSKRFRHVESDLLAHCARMEKDYQDYALHGVRIPMQSHGSSEIAVLKYDVGSRDLKRHPRECFRFLCVQLEKSDPIELFGFAIYFKSDKENMLPNEIAAEIRRLRHEISRHDDDNETAISNGA